MAVVRLPSIHMSSAFPTMNDLLKETIQKDHGRPYRYLPQHRTLHAELPSTFSPPRSPQFTAKHAQFIPHEEFDAPSRMPLSQAHGFEAVVSPASSPSSSQRKRRRYSDLRMADRVSGSSDVASPLGTAVITSTSIRALVHDDDDFDQSLRRCSVTYDDGHSNWAASSPRGSGRDSDLWEASVGQIDHDDKDSSGTAAATATATSKTASTSNSRPVITNASRNITFEMLQVHFSKSLKDAANCFGVCTTLLKKICRKNGIVSWPYRQIIGLQKSITSMEQQVHYFDGEQRRQYAEQLRKLHIKLDAYIRTGEAPSDEELAVTNPSQPTIHSAPSRSANYNTHSAMAPIVTLGVSEPQQQQQSRQQLQQQQQRYSWPTASKHMSQNAYDCRQHGEATQDDAVAAAAQQHSPSRLPSIAYILNQQSPPHSHQVQYHDQHRHRQQPQPHFLRDKGYRDW